MAQMTVDEALRLGIQYQQSGRLDEAEAIYRRVLAQQPDHAYALNLLGALAGETGRTEVAEAMFRRAASAAPREPMFHINLGRILMGQGQWNEAEETYRRALELNPRSLEALGNLGRICEQRGQYDQAVGLYRQALQIDPDHAGVHYNLGVALGELGRQDEAIAAYRRAVELQPDYAEAHNNLGVALKDQQRFDESIAAYRAALALRPEAAEVHCNLGVALQATADHEQAIACFRRAMALKPDDPMPYSNLLFAMLYHPESSAAAISRELRAWRDRFARPIPALMQPHTNDRTPDRPLRIGYVSPDFREHAVGRNILPLFRAHDRRQFAIFCYSGAAPDAMTRHFRELADGWVETHLLSDDQLVERIRADAIDVLVDLALHTSGNRLLTFARRPAPVQATFAGYPGSTGLKTIDWRLTDPFLDPPGMHDELYSEQSLRLPATFWCFDPLGEHVPVNPLPAAQPAAGGRISFGCLNNFCKINDRVVALWARVLAGVPGSRLLLLAAEGSHRRRVFDAFESHGITPQRIEFVSHRPRAPYLEYYHQIDIGLDTVPYGGHTTSLDSLWMGVPVVTLVGQTVVGRAGLSQLTNLGLTELIAQTPDDYVRIAVDLAGNLSRLKDLRAGLRGRMEKSPLMDAAAFARGVEAAYRTMWRRWCERVSNSPLGALER